MRDEKDPINAFSKTPILIKLLPIFWRMNIGEKIYGQKRTSIVLGQQL